MAIENLDMNLILKIVALILEIILKKKQDKNSAISQVATQLGLDRSVIEEVWEKYGNKFS